MKKRLLLFISVLIFFMTSNLIFGKPFTFRNKLNVSFTSTNSINCKKMGDDSLEEFCRNGIYFICDANNFSEVMGEDKKNEIVIGNFKLYVYTKNNQIKYKINSISVKTESDEFNMEDILYLPYPYQEPLQTDFEKDKLNPDYYISRFLLGYFKFPAKNKEPIKIIVDVECGDTIYNFEYDYSVKKRCSIITFND